MIINDLKAKVPEKAEVRLDLLLQALQIKKSEIPESSDYEMPQVEINKFNSKFEFYAGDQVSANNVKVLLNIGGYGQKREKDEPKSTRIYD